MRKFGIELEMVAPSGQRPLDFANATVRAVGIPMMTNSHFGRAYDQWQAKPDGSIQPYDRGVEVVSRILPAAESSYDEIRRAVGALEIAGFGINRTCGFHVHIDVSDLSPTAQRLIILRYAQLQPQVSAMLPPSRRTNGYCPVMTPSQRSQLAAEIDNGMERWALVLPHFSVTNMQHMATTANGRIEFRQAAATCNAAKVIGWVRFLQEMIDEVARRADGVLFGRAPAAPIITPSRPVMVPMVTAGRVPTMRNGSDADRALTQLCTHGVITAVWASANGIGENVLRRIIVGFRRHGAGLITSRHDGNAAYVLSGANALPVTREQVFAQTTVTMPVVVAPLSDHHMAIAWWIARDAAGAAARAADAARDAARDAAGAAAGAAPWAAARAAARDAAADAPWDAAWAAARAAAGAAARGQSDPVAIGNTAWAAAWTATQNAVRTIVGAQATASPPVPIQPSRVQAATFGAYPVEAGLSIETAAWCRDRRDTFDSSEEHSANATRAA